MSTNAVRYGSARPVGAPAGAPVALRWSAVHPLRAALLAVADRVFGSLDRSRGSAPVRAHLDRIVTSFLDGYRAAVGVPHVPALAATLNEVESPLRGFAYEGAAMALALMDALVPGRHRLRLFLAGPAAPHIYMAHVGAGWALARLRLLPTLSIRRQLDEMLCWLAIDGYGFHEALFSTSRVVGSHRVPGRLRGYSARAFDQGVGRALWFVDAADVDRIAQTIADFPESRRADLWSGAALAATYAGGVDIDQVRALKTHARGYESHVAQGAAFAAEARVRADNRTPHTDAACVVLSGVDALAAAVLVRNLRALAAHSGGTPAYERWRHRIGVALVG